MPIGRHVSSSGCIRSFDHDVAKAVRLKTNESLSLIVPVLGVGVRFRSNHEMVIEMCRRTFGFWNTLVPSPQPVRYEVSLFVEDGVIENVACAQTVTEANQLEIEGDGLSGRADPHSGKARTTFSLGWLDYPELLGGYLIEGMTLFLISGDDRIPLHAAGVSASGTAAILHGPSGSGKSTLAYLCGVAGLQVFGEDIIYIEPGARLRIWGGVSRFSLLPEVARVFSDPSDLDPTLLSTGKKKVLRRIDPAVRSEIPLDNFVICLLRPGKLRSAWRSVPSGEAAREVIETGSPGFDVHNERLTRCAAVLTVRSVELDLTADAEAGAAAIVEILRIHSSGSSP
jgi:hypothetical protein